MVLRKDMIHELMVFFVSFNGVVFARDLKPEKYVKRL